MPFAAHRVAVRAPVETLWALLVEKIRAPQRFVPGVESVEIVRDLGPLAVERRMLAGGAVIHEQIVGDEATLSVFFKLIDDPRHSGFVLNVIYPGEVPELEFVMHWAPRAGTPEDATDWQAAIVKAVEQSKALAEAA